MIIFSFIILVIINHISCVILQIKNIDVLQKELINAPLDINLDFSYDINSNLLNLEKSHICFLRDGERCYCYKELFYETDLHVPYSCINNSKINNKIGYWFAIEIIGETIDNKDKKITYISTPVFISPSSSSSIEYNLNSRINMKTGCLDKGTCKLIGSGVHIDSNVYETIDINSKITLILPLFLDDITRVVILIDSLKFIISSLEIKEFLIIIPDSQFIVIGI